MDNIDNKKPKRRGLFERLFRPQEIQLNTNTDKPKETKVDAVKTTTTNIVGLADAINTGEQQLYHLYNEMDQDAIISAALDLFADNATMANSKTGHVAAVQSGDLAFQEEINDFLWNIFKVDTEAWHIVRNIAKHGKVLLDTKAVNNGRDWSFTLEDEPYNIQILVNNANEIEHFAIAPEKQDNKSNSMYASAIYSKKDNNYTLEPKDRFIVGLNSRENNGTMTVRSTSALTGEPIDEELKIRTGRSILAPVLSTWQILNTMEQALITNRLTKATQFKIVQVDIADSTNKEAVEIQDALKKAFKSAETLDYAANKYNNRLAPPTVDDVVIVTKRGEKGAIDVQAIGGESTEAPMGDIDYMRNKLFAGLGVLKAYLGFEETTPGGLGDSTLTKLDERIGRRVLRLQAILADVLKDAINYYWQYSRTDRTLANIPDYTILMGKVSTQEEQERRNSLTESFSIANSVVALAKDELFADKVDPDKLFNYVWEEILNIDTKRLDKLPNEEDIGLKVNKLDKVKESTYLVKNRKAGTGILEGKKHNLVSLEDFNRLLEHTDVILETEDYKQYTLDKALDLKRFRDNITEETYKDLKNASKGKDPQRLAKSKKSIVRYTGLDEDNFITFTVTAEDPEKNKKSGRPTSYNTRVQLKDIEDILLNKGNMNDLEAVRRAVEGDIAVSCTCPAAKYWGQQYVGTKNGYSIDKNDIAPTVRIPTQPICKHTIQTLSVLPFWTNTITRDLRNKGVLKKVEKLPPGKEKEKEEDTEGDK